MIKARDTLVRMKFSLINIIRDLLRSGGTNISELTPESLSKEGAKVLPVELRDTQNGLLTQLFHIREEIRNYHSKTKQEISCDAKATRQIKGVAPITAVSFVLVIGDPRRFPNRECLAAYL